jgi:hypothetical protein
VYQGVGEIHESEIRYTLDLSEWSSGVTLAAPLRFFVVFHNPDFGTRQCALDAIALLMDAALGNIGGGNGFNLAAAAAGAGDPSERLPLSTYRALRDQLLKQSPQGHYFTDLYQQVSPALVQTISDHTWLLWRAANVVQTWAPAFQELVEGRGNQCLITPTMLAEGQDFLDLLKAVASVGLVATIQTEEEALEIRSWAGLTMTEALARVESRRIPAAFTRVRIREVGGALLVQWWGEAGLSYRLHRSLGRLDSFQPMGDWLPGSGGEMSASISPAEGETSFYRLEVREDEP